MRRTILNWICRDNLVNEVDHLAQCRNPLRKRVEILPCPPTRATRVAAQARKRNCLLHNLWEARTIESKDRSEYIRTTTFLWLHNAHHSWLTSFKMHIALDKAKVCQSDWQRCPFQTDTYLKIVGLVLECIFFGISFDLVPDAISTEPARRHLHPLLFSCTFCPFQQIIHRPN